MQKKNFFLLLHAQDVGGVSLYKRNRYSSSSTISEWKESFIRKSLPTLILASAFPEEQKIFLFFYNLRVEEGSAKDVIFSSSSTFFQETLLMGRKRTIFLLLQSQDGRRVLLCLRKTIKYLNHILELLDKRRIILFEEKWGMRHGDSGQSQ